MAQRPRYQPGQCVYNDHGRKLSAAEHIIADRQLFIDFTIDQALIDALVTPGKQDQILSGIQ